MNLLMDFTINEQRTKFLKECGSGLTLITLGVFGAIFYYVEEKFSSL